MHKRYPEGELLMRYLAFLTCALLLAAAPQGRQKSHARQSNPASAQSGPGSEPLPTFMGTVRGGDRKGLLIEDAEANTLSFNCSRKTKYFDGNRRIDALQIKPGDHVSVDARRALDGTLDAVNVRRDKSKSQSPPTQ